MASMFVLDANGGFGFTVGAGGETVNGSGTSGALAVYGGADAESIVGGSGADTLSAGTGADTLTGGAGNNTFVIGVGGNSGVGYVITDFSSSDVVYLGGSGTAASLLAAATVSGGNTTITLSNGATVTFVGVTAPSELDGHLLVESGLPPSSFVTPVIVAAAGETLAGGNGGALLTAGGDTVIGGAGAETVTGNSVSGLAINSTGSFDVITAAGDSLAGSAGAETITDSAGSVTLFGTTNGEVLSGGPNTHTITGGAGNDTLIAGAGNVTLTGGAGNDYLDGGIGTDVAVYSGPRADYLVTTLASGAIQITDERAGSPDGTDTVSNVGYFQFSDGLYSAAEISCFYRGTLIGTPDGEVPVETLKPGDLVATSDGRLMPVRWLGRQTVSTTFADPLRILPIRIKAGALGAGVPSRDLLLSPDHAVLVEQILIQAGALLNGTSIVRETNVPETFTYYHVELDDHALILADNTPAESFIDNIDRLGFDNWTEHEALYPEGKPIVEMSYPRAKAHRQVPRAIRERLVECGAEFARTAA